MTSFISAPAAGTLAEIELLLCCARTSVSAARAERIRAILRENLDWAFLLQTAHRHHVLPLLYRSLHTTCPEAVPKATLNQLQADSHANTLRNLGLTRELLRLLHMFEMCGIPAIPYKGLILAMTAYGNLGLRQFGDLDILVHENDYGRSQDLLISQGYHFIQSHRYETSFLKENGRVWVDLHKAFTPSVFPVAFDFEGLWRRRESISIGGTTVPNFSSEDMLIILCVQVAKDESQGRYQLAKICDIAELLRVHQRMDWGRVIEHARRLGRQRILLFGLRLANQLLGAVLPEDVLRSMQADPLVSELVSQFRKRLFDETYRRPNQVDDIARFITNTRSHSKYRERVREKILPVVVPDDKDRAIFLLPDTLQFLYYVIRPFRLLRKAGSCLFASLRRTPTSSRG